MAQHHTISGLVGKLVTESEVNCNADKYYEMFKQHEDVPKAIPHIFTAVKVIEGHGSTSGCVKHGIIFMRVRTNLSMRKQHTMMKQGRSATVPLEET
ncbi:hypothetical protein MKX01_006931 [Papaver californicum]|nr:hypothetical protein MKX01_006931 [Papaver californicum]